MNPQIVLTRPSYGIKDWAVACGIGEDTVRQNISEGRLLVRYPTEKGAKAVIFVEDGFDWFRRLPTEPSR